MIEIGSDINFTPNIDEQSAPHQFLCPISRQFMRNPVITVDGYSFEKQAIQKWFKSKNTSPITGLKLENRIIQNRALKSAIFYHNQRDAKASQNAQKLVQNAYDYLSSTLPQLINDVGLVDTDKLVVISIENLQLRKALERIKVAFQKIEGRVFGVDTKYCDACIRMREGHQVIKQIIKQSEHILSTPPIIQKLSTQALEFQYLPISCQTLKDIDFQISKKDSLQMKKFKSYGVEKLPLQTLVKRIKVANKIPPEHFVQVWRAEIALNDFFTKIKKQLEQQSCSYIRKIKQEGKRLTDLRVHLQDLKLGQGEYLIIEHGSMGPPKQQFVFRGDEIKCRYCYKLKPQKFKCICDNISYCSKQCGEKDKEYHKKQCSKLQIVAI